MWEHHVVAGVPACMKQITFLLCKCWSGHQISGLLHNADNDIRLFCGIIMCYKLNR